SLPRVEQDPEYAKAVEDSLKYVLHEIPEGDSIQTKNYVIHIGNVNRNPSNQDYHPQAGDLALGLPLRIKAINSDLWQEVEPALVLRKDFVLTYPVQINDLSMKIRLPQQLFEQYFELESSLKYREFILKKGGFANVDGYKVSLNKINSAPDHPNYEAEEGDIAVAAELDIIAPNGSKGTAAPVFLIRGNQSFSLKDVAEELGVHIRFDKVDPVTETLNLSLAKGKLSTDRKIPVEVAEDSLRSDYIVLQAIRFPGINLFWFGSLLMLFGLFFAMIRRMRS
ncbi:MAG: cytochrome c assembly protein, partial [Saprospiraceae bacterium]|nr:cytochrome c assembly protein [Saprospiraceae bacterium]